MARELDPNPSGLCMCGCGGRTSVVQTDGNARKGDHRRYIFGHRRSSEPEYLVDPNTGCWVWNRSVKSDGYGSAKVGGVTTSAHRVYWERANGPVPSGLELDHLCRNRACVNPEHLEAVTRIENIRRSSLTKITTEDALAMREAASLGAPRKALCAAYSVSKSTVSRILCADSVDCAR